MSKRIYGTSWCMSCLRKTPRIVMRHLSLLKNVQNRVEAQSWVRERNTKLSRVIRLIWEFKALRRMKFIRREPSRRRELVYLDQNAAEFQLHLAWSNRISQWWLSGGAAEQRKAVCERVLDMHAWPALRVHLMTLMFHDMQFKRKESQMTGAESAERKNKNQSQNPLATFRPKDAMLSAHLLIDYWFAWNRTSFCPLNLKAK